MDMDFADIKPSVVSAIMVLLFVILTVPLAKFIMGGNTGKVYIPGLSELVAAI